MCCENIAAHVGVIPPSLYLVLLLLLPSTFTAVSLADPLF